VEKNSALPSVFVDLDKRRMLRFTMGSLRRAEKRLNAIRGSDVSIFQILSEENKGKLGPDEIIVLFHHGLAHEDPNLTEDNVADMIDVRELDILGARLAEALGGAVTTKQPSPEANGDRPLARSPGSSSGPSGASS
jgi:hypothetical protein